MKKFLIVLTLIVVFLAQFIFAPLVYADGGFFVHSDLSGWKSVYEREQLAAINYENGRQNMLLEINLPELSGNKAVWLFPIPAKPEEISLDVVKAMPQWEGYDSLSLSYKNILYGFAGLSVSQIYGLLPLAALTFIAGTTTNVTVGNEENEVTVHQQLEKMGLTTELITAKNSDVFYNYLVAKGLDLPSDMKAILEAYTNKDYSFVVSWISDLASFIKAQESYSLDQYSAVGDGKYIISVYTSFPTKNIYFPLIPTSIYGEEKIPIRIQITGHVQPEFAEQIKKDAQVDYSFDSSGFQITDNLKFFFNNKSGFIRNFKFTDIHIYTASSNFTQDLLIKPKTPLSIASVDFMNSYFTILLLIFFILMSGFSGLIAGRKVFKREERISSYKLFLFGLFNFLTVIGLALAVRFMKVNSLSLRNRGFVGYFMLFFFIFNIIIPGILMLSIALIV